jgi:hypothetical protein
LGDHDVVEQITREIEYAFVGHRSLLAQWPGAALVWERGSLRFETPIAELPYNGVIRSPSTATRAGRSVTSSARSARAACSACGSRIRLRLRATSGRGSRRMGSGRSSM